MRDIIEAPQRQTIQTLRAQQQPAVLIDAFESRKLYRANSRISGFAGGSRLNPSTCGSATCTMVQVLAGAGALLDEPFISESTVAYEDLVGSSTGSASIAWADWVTTTKGLLQKQDPKPESKPTSSAAAKLRVDRLTYIQAVLGLPMQAMADVLGITRQGLYKWLDVTKDTNLQEANQHRLAVVESLVAQWRERSNAPLGSMVNTPLTTLTKGRTVLDMLKGGLDERSITVAFDELAAMLSTKPKTLSQRMADSGFRRRPSARSLPPDE